MVSSSPGLQQLKPVQRKIRSIRCDNGGEFDSKSFKAAAEQRGYTFERTAPGTSSQNGLAERYNGVVVEAMRAIMRQHNVPKDWWCFAMEHSTVVENMLPAKTLGDRAPFFLWTGKVPDVSRLRIFGCLAYTHRW